MKTFYIYTLTNPNNGLIFYVGCTIFPNKRAIDHRIFNRKRNHKGIYLTEPHFTFTPRENYILEHKIVPIMNVVETVICNNRLTAEVIEANWIMKLKNDGQPLTNKCIVIKRDLQTA